MDQLKPAQHGELAAGGWAELSFAAQMANIGSEVSRALKWKAKGNPGRSERAFCRALELIDLSIACVQTPNPGRLKELCRAREELCDYFTGAGTLRTDPERMLRYYDQFVLIR